MSAAGQMTCVERTGAWPRRAALRRRSLTPPPWPDPDSRLVTLLSTRTSRRVDQVFPTALKAEPRSPRPDPAGTGSRQRTALSFHSCEDVEPELGPFT